MPLEDRLAQMIDIPLEYIRLGADISTFIDQLLGNMVYSVVCDLGCGDGTRFGRMLRRHAKYLVGFDLKPHVLAEAQKIYDKTILADIRSFDQYLDGFDAVFMFFSIEHLSKEDGLTLLRRMIPKTKLICIATDTKHGPSGSQLFGSPYDSDVHKTIWTPQEFQQLGFNCWLIQQNNPYWKSLWGDHILAIYEGGNP